MSPWAFFLLVFALSLPLWLLDPFTVTLRERLPIALPFSALQAAVPFTAAALLIHRQAGVEGVRRLSRRAFDLARVGNPLWYAPTLLLWPAVAAVAYGLMHLTGAPLPDDPHVPLLALPPLLALFLVSAAFEQLGWMGYAVDPLQRRWGALGASVLLGSVWALWHVVPFLQIPQPPSWVLWQCLAMIPFRILIVWLYNNMGRSVFATILFQATANTSQFAFPNLGSHYDPFYAFAVLSLVAGVVVAVWGPRTLARPRSVRGRALGAAPRAGGAGER